MFGYINGKVVDIKKDYILVDNNNFGFLIYTIKSSVFALNNTYKFFIYDCLKDQNEWVLYGFLDYNELLLFRKLILVNGIGPKSAINILKNSSVNELVSLIKNKDYISLNKIGGVGSKGQTIIYELHNKLDEFNYSLFRYNNVHLALKSIGFSTDEISSSLLKLDDGLTDEEALNLAVKLINHERVQ